MTSPITTGTIDRTRSGLAPSSCATAGWSIRCASSTRTADVVVLDGRIAAVGRSRRRPGRPTPIPRPRSSTAPGCIDHARLHRHPRAHVMKGLGDFCVGADEVGVQMGVPIVVDGGTSGVATFDLARAP
jgi:dihydroorotase